MDKLFRSVFFFPFFFFLPRSTFYLDARQQELLTQFFLFNFFFFFPCFFSKYIFCCPFRVELDSFSWLTTHFVVHF